MLHELEKEMSQVQNNLVKKEMELEKQQCVTSELELSIQEAKQDKCKAEYGHLRAEIKKLKDCLEDAEQQQRLAGEAWASTVPTHFLHTGPGAGPVISNYLLILISPYRTAVSTAL